MVKEEVADLVESGATINYTDFMGRSALHIAAIYVKLFRILTDTI